VSDPNGTPRGLDALLDLDVLSARQAGQLKKALLRFYVFSEGTMALRAFIDRHIDDILYKRHSVRHFSRRKRGGCYAKLKNPKDEYALWFRIGGQEVGYDIPKLLYKCLQVKDRSKEGLGKGVI